MHDEAENHFVANKKNSRSVTAGDWQAYLTDKKLTPEQKFQKIKETAQIMEKKALRMEYQLKQ